MKDFTKNEETDMALGLDALSQVPDGVKMPTGGTVLPFPDHWLFVTAHAVSRHKAGRNLPDTAEPTE